MQGIEMQGIEMQGARYGLYIIWRLYQVEKTKQEVINEHMYKKNIKQISRKV